MTRQKRIVFWLSLLWAIVGGVAAYFLMQTPTSLASGAGDSADSATDVATEDAPADADSTDTVGEEKDQEATSSPGVWRQFTAWMAAVPVSILLAIVLLTTIGFWASWHGASVSVSAGTPLSGAVWGLFSGVFIWMALIALVPVVYWCLDLPFPDRLMDLATYSLVAGVLAWQLGFWSARPWAVQDPAPTPN